MLPPFQAKPSSSFLSFFFFFLVFYGIFTSLRQSQVEGAGAASCSFLSVSAITRLLKKAPESPSLVGLMGYGVWIWGHSFVEGLAALS